MSDAKQDSGPDEIKIGSFEASHYLLKGTAYIDQLLLGTEPLNCPVIFVKCESWADVMLHWEERDDSMPWSVHPNVIDRIREESEQR